MVAGLFVFSAAFVDLWLGHAYAHIATAFVWIGLGTAALVMTAPAHYLLIACGQMRADVERSGVGVLLIVLGGLVAAAFGNLSIAAAANATAAIGACVTLYVRSRHVTIAAAAGASWVRYYLLMAVACLPGAAAAILIARLAPGGWLTLGSAVMAFLTLSAACARAIGFVNAGELAMLGAGSAAGSPAVDITTPASPMDATADTAVVRSGDPT
jgi:O-antigen/teichoic acid export membrane protein